MTIAFRYFPYLVQQQVMNQMDLFDIFSYYSISKKSKAVAKSYFNRQEFDLCYSVNLGSFWIYRPCWPKDCCYYGDRVKVEFKTGIEVLKRCRPTEQKETVAFNYPEDTSDPKVKIIKFAKDMFPKLFFRIMFCPANLAFFLDTMSFVKSFNIPIERVDAGVHLNANTDELLSAVMTQCSDVKKLQLDCRWHDPFQYDFRTHASLKFDFFELMCSRLVSKDHLLPIFTNCKKVILKAYSGVYYTDQELTEICKQWLEAKETQYLRIEKVQTANESIWKLPGAVRVQEVTVGDISYTYQQWEFDQGKCCLMKKADGTPAIVYQDKFESIYFRTDFKNAVIGVFSQISNLT